MAERTTAFSRRLARTVVGDIVVSTMCFGMRVAIFETMLMTDVNGELDGWVRSYANEDEARTGHELIVQALREGRRP